MNWLGLVLAILAIARAILELVGQKRGADAAAAREALASLEKASARIQTAVQARAAVRDDLNRHPERLRDDDGFRRPD